MLTHLDSQAGDMFARSAASQKSSLRGVMGEGGFIDHVRSPEMDHVVLPGFGEQNTDKNRIELRHTA